MQTLFFCARDIRDYLKAIIDTSDLNNTPDFDPNFPALTDAPAIQNFLLDVMKIYDDYDQAINAPICGETDIDGLRLDFNFGLRLEVPRGNFHVTIGDADSGQIFFERDLSDVRLISVEKHFIRWQVEVSLDGREIFSHVLNLENQNVLVTFKRDAALGDMLAYLPSIEAFRRANGCDVKIFMPNFLRDFTAHLYPALKQVDAVTFDSYATYYPVMCIGDYSVTPFDSRNESMERASRKIFGRDVLNVKPTFKPTMPPVTNEPYVCIGVQASGNRKGWLYPNGWDIVVDYLKRLGYRVFCIDKNAEEINDGLTIQKPAGAEDFTGNISILERANMLYHAKFFIGLGSGLSWLADAVNCPVVMIGGFSKDWFEFYTPYRVANRFVCNGCLNDVRVHFILNACPYHHDTPRELECQKKIFPRQVIGTIERLIVDRKLKPPNIL